MTDMTDMMNMTRTTPMQHLKHTSTMHTMHTMHTMKTIEIPNRTLARRLLAGLAAGITLGGCAAPTAPPLTFAGTPTTTSTMTTKDPWRTSLDGAFDRSGWPPIRFEIPMASVPCNPTYASPVVPDDDGVGRLQETGAFPTVETAMSLETDRSQVRWSAAADPFVAAFDLVASPFRMIGAPPDSTVLEPRGDWELLPGCVPSAAVAPEASEIEETDRSAPASEPDPTEDQGPSDEEDEAPTTTAGSAGWTISPVFDRPADATTSSENEE